MARDQAARRLLVRAAEHLVDARRDAWHEASVGTLAITMRRLTEALLVELAGARPHVPDVGAAALLGLAALAAEGRLEPLRVGRLEAWIRAGSSLHARLGDPATGPTIAADALADLTALARTLEPLEATLERILGAPCPLPLGPPRTPPALMGFGFSGLETMPEQTFFAGFWGYGVNTSAFYFVEATPRRRVYFRLSFGGAYEDSAQDRRALATFLTAYASLRQHPALASLRAWDAMGEGRWEIAWAGGERRTITRSLHGAPDFAVLGPGPKQCVVTGRTVTFAVEPAGVRVLLDGRPLPMTYRHTTSLATNADRYETVVTPTAPASHAPIADALLAPEPFEVWEGTKELTASCRFGASNTAIYNTSVFDLVSVTLRFPRDLSSVLVERDHHTDASS